MRAPVAVIATVAVVTLACGATRPAKPWIDVLHGQAPQACAQHFEAHGAAAPAPHIHASFFAWPKGAPTEPGDQLWIQTGAASAWMAVYPREASTLEAPLGLGSHSIRWRWLRADGRILAESLMFVLVGNCGDPHSWKAAPQP